MDLNAIWVFTRVVQTGSFSEAARSLELPKSTVSRKVSELEEQLGARLLQRTTRKLSLTDVGRAYYQHALRAVGELEQAHEAVTSLQTTPRGLLRVTAPLNMSYLGPVMSSFLGAHPGVELELMCTDRVVNLVEEGVDVGIRAGQLRDSGLIARPLGAMRSWVVASPAFVAAYGAPQAPSDLPRFQCIVFGAGSDRSHWKLRAENKLVTIEVKARLIVNDFDMVHAAAVAGTGIAMLPSYRTRDDLHAGRLVRLLGEYCSPETPMHAVYPSVRHLSPKVAAFVDHLRQTLALPWGG